MLIVFIICVFIMLHIYFLLSNIIFGTEGVQFFQFMVWYDFSREIAIESLFFALGCVVSFVFGYKVFYRRRFPLPALEMSDFRYSNIELYFMNLFGLLAITYMAILVIIADFNYSVMTQIRESDGFIFELRIIYLLLLSRMMLNIPLNQLIQHRKYRVTRAIFLLYFILAILFQARSVVFEIVAIFAFAHLMWEGDQVKWRYLGVLIFAFLVPNLMVLGRLGLPDNPYELIGQLFTFEYSVFANKFLSTAIYSGSEFSRDISFVSSLPLIIPSALRDLLNIAVIKSDYYFDFAFASEIEGGGFSMLAELYSNFGWAAILIMILLGMLIGYWNIKSSRVGQVSYIYAAAPLIYISFVLALRNDFGVFLKYIFQLLLVASFLGVIFKAKWANLQS